MIETFESSFVSRYGFKEAILLSYMCHETQFIGKKEFTALALKKRFYFLSEKMVRDAIKKLIREKGIILSTGEKKGMAPRTIQYKVTASSLKQYSCEAIDKSMTAGKEQ
jgi:hypothetical protein